MVYIRVDATRRCGCRQQPRGGILIGAKKQYQQQQQQPYQPVISYAPRHKSVGNYIGPSTVQYVACIAYVVWCPRAPHHPREIDAALRLRERGERPERQNSALSKDREEPPSFVLPYPRRIFFLFSFLFLCFPSSIYRSSYCTAVHV